jgi:hypothetical protein
MTGDEGADSYRVEVLDGGLFSGCWRLLLFSDSVRVSEGIGGADAISYPGGGEFGIGGCSCDVKVGGRRDEEDVGNGNGGGGSSFSGGTSVMLASFPLLLSPEGGEGLTIPDV